MVVDDHPLVRSAVAKAIAGDGMVVVAEASSAEEALRARAPGRPGHPAPGHRVCRACPGVELVRELAPRLPNTRIVMLTMSSADRDVADAMRYGASGYLTKDLSPEALRAIAAGDPDGELVMPRRLAGRLLAQACGAAPAGDPGRGAAHRPPDRPRAGHPAPARRRPQRSRHRDGPHDLETDGRVAREQHPAQAGREEPRRGRAPLQGRDLTRRPVRARPCRVHRPHRGLGDAAGSRPPPSGPPRGRPRSRRGARRDRSVRISMPRPSPTSSRSAPAATTASRISASGTSTGTGPRQTSRDVVT